ncbi:MAG: insulinase family protein [candidate division Zixibacteria bacterium]|nr:insulinase family protein [candidate division Zixibacteria bacterium]
MRKMLFCTAVLLLATQVVAADFDLQVEKAILDNGLTLLTCEDHSVPTASVQTFVNVGSRDEDRPGITGLAHVFEHMMFRGTEKFPDYGAAVAPLGAQNNAYTSEDYTCYFINAQAKFLEQLLEVESDRIRNLCFTEEAFRTELGPVKEERRRGIDDDPAGFLEVELYREAYTRHTYQHPVIGWEEDLEVNMTFTDGLQFKNRFYVPNNCVLVICGNIETASVRDLVQKYYGDWEQGKPYIPQVNAEPPQTVERIRNFVWKDGQTAPLLRIGYHAPSIQSDFTSLATLRLINEILFSRSGRLSRLLINELSLVESIYGDLNVRKDPGLLVIGARLHGDVSPAEVRDSVYSQLELLKTVPISTEELTRACNNLRAQMIYFLDRPARVAGAVGFYHLVGGDYQTMIELYNLYSQIDAAKIMTVTAEVFDQYNRTVVSMVPKGTN